MKKNIELFTTFFKVGILTFGGGLAMLPMLTREVVNKRKWATEEEILDYYAIGQCTPGIIAVNTATFIGYKQNGKSGAAFATFGVVCPSLIIISIIAALLQNYMTLPVVGHALAGIRIAVSGLLLQTAYSMIKKGVKDKFGALLFVIAASIAFFTPVPTIMIIIAAAVTGIVYKSITAKKQETKDK